MAILKNWDKTTSFLHLGLAITVTFQLIFALLMTNGFPKIFIYHEIDGLIIIAIVITHWCWSVFSKKYRLEHLFPWNKQGMLAVIRDLNGIVQNRLPEGGPRGGLPGFVHGLGFLAVTGMAVTGFFIFISIQLQLGWQLPKNIHVIIADFVWIYWVGHLAMAAIHFFADNVTQDTYE